MDMQREREAFDQYFKEKYQEFHNEVFDENGDDRAIIGYSFAWSAWQAAKAHEAEKLKGCVVVPESEIQMSYLDEDEYMYIDEPDNFLCDIPIGKTVEVSRRAYMDKTSCFAAIEWDAENEDVGTWELFETKEEADKAAAHCKAMVEAARGGNE